MYYGISDLNAQGGLVSFNTHGPGTIAGQTVSFVQVSTAITYEAGHTYTFVVYATETAVKVGATKIYVTSAHNNTVTTYNADGTQTTPTITAGLDRPYGVAVDAAGKIYVTNHGNNTVTTYNADGTQTTPTIAIHDADGNLSVPSGIAVGANGNFYVINLAPGLGIYHDGFWMLTTYKPDGSQTTPTIFIGNGYGLDPSGVAVDAAGKIYVSNSSSSGGYVPTFNQDGTQTTPTITIGVTAPTGVAVDAAGEIHLANLYTVTTYKADGTPTAPTITGLSGPCGIAVDAASKIYVLNSAVCGGKDIVTTYNPDGTASTPTINAGLSNPTSIAVH